jgi:hypothetical protein
VFSSEHLGHKLIKLFSDELQAGDPIFDDRIYVDTEQRDATAALLASETIQSALLQLVAHDFTVTTDGHGFRARRCEQDPVELGDVEFAAAAFLRAATQLNR